MTPDQQLLSEYARTNSQDAFGELVRRHVNLVYSTALRQVNGDTHLAQDVAQTVFTDLARKARLLCQRLSLSGWLYTSTRFAAAKVARAESRRREREVTFMRESSEEPASEADWETIRPVLDDAMHELKEGDREAIVLRYFESRPFTEIGERLGLNENAARMRTERALAKLHTAFARRSITATATLTSVISAHAVQMAPTGLAATLTAASVAAAGNGTLTLIGLMATKLKLGAAAILVAGAATTIVLQHQAQAKLRADNEGLRQQLEQMRADQENPPAPTESVTNQSLADAQFSELLRLRGEVGVLRRQTNDLTRQLAGSKLRPQNAAADQASSRQEESEDNPRTPDAATRTIFETWARGDWDKFFDKYGEPGVPRELYDKAFTEEVRKSVAEMQIVSVGEPTNSFASNMWFVPYKIRFKDGTEKDHRLHIAQDPTSQRWYFKGGF